MKIRNFTSFAIPIIAWFFIESIAMYFGDHHTTGVLTWMIITGLVVVYQIILCLMNLTMITLVIRLTMVMLSMLGAIYYFYNC